MARNTHLQPGWALHYCRGLDQTKPARLLTCAARNQNTNTTTHDEESAHRGYQTCLLRQDRSNEKQNRPLAIVRGSENKCRSLDKLGMTIGPRELLVRRSVGSG
ncbi:MAG: hypothetical protein A3F68_02605 [Acidobacteria bacterium RIFCSPLOWO2_12_FULL_54_10]|nr:MAG: hypothetical protein A3F68_02605 [Acidobacteria bacterium RIFCSPLOWO2_12_FULL_54_10]